MRTVHIHAPLECASHGASFAVRRASEEGIGNGGSVIALELLIQVGVFEILCACGADAGSQAVVC